MITIDANAMSMVKVTGLEPGELFVFSGGIGDFIAVVVENHEKRSMSWLRLTGNDRFFLNYLDGNNLRVHAPDVLRLGLHWKDLQLQMDETRIKRTSVVPDIGCLLLAEQPYIVSKFQVFDGRDVDDAFGISLREIAREHVGRGGYCCEHWRLVRARQGLPPELIAEFGSNDAPER